MRRLTPFIKPLLGHIFLLLIHVDVFAADPYKWDVRRYYGIESVPAPYTSYPQHHASDISDICEQARSLLNAAPGIYTYLPGLVVGLHQNTTITPEGDEGFKQIHLVNLGSAEYCRYPGIRRSDGQDMGLIDFDPGYVNYCAIYEKYNNGANRCEKYIDTHYDDDRCVPGVGNPIEPLTGIKRQSTSLGSLFPGWGNPELHYNTRRQLTTSQDAASFLSLDSLGDPWYSSLHKLLSSQAGSLTSVIASRGTGQWVSFTKAGSSYTTSSALNATLRDNAAQDGWYYVDSGVGTLENYIKRAGAGFLSVESRANGLSRSFTYSDSTTPSSVAPDANLLISVADQFGRTVQIAYEKPAGAKLSRMTRITDPAGNFIQFAYDPSGRLSDLTWQDGSTKSFLYENAALPWALTGVVDENRKVFATFTYAPSGSATSTEHAGQVDKYSITYPSFPVYGVTETVDPISGTIKRSYAWSSVGDPSVVRPNGAVGTYTSGMVNGVPRLIAQSQPAGSGCAASTSNQSFDSSGNTTSRDDFNGVRTCYSNDQGRNLETARIEGLSTTTDCGSVLAVGTTLPAGSRKITTSWHPHWSLATRIAEAGRITTSVYNGQPDPFSGGAIASCAPSTALLSDGKPIAVLCRRVEQATTDVDGHLGLAAPLQAGVASRQTSWTYNQYGQVLTAKGPRTDVNDTTTFVYYADSTADHMIGDLQSVTDASGKATTYNKYNKFGQLLQSTDSNGVITINTFDLRQRLLSTSTAGETTSYAYDPVGQLVTVTLPNGATLTHTYDDAHRLIQVSDLAGNKVIYTLDEAGNRVGEQVKDASGTLVRNVSRSFDALGRLQSVTGAQQ